MSRTNRMSTTPATAYTTGEWLSSRSARTVATSSSQTMENGMRIFQPSAISWSYRVRGSVARRRAPQPQRADQQEEALEEDPEPRPPADVHAWPDQGQRPGGPPAAKEQR